MPESLRTLEETTTKKVFWRIVPMTFVLYVISYIDRANLGYAALQMNAELGLTSEAFGFAAGIFFFGYFLFEVPSNIALAKFGARIWIARICITWGILAVITGFVQTPTQLYTLRFLLGVAEAGFFPGIIIYLLAWTRAKEQATTVAMFTAAIPVSYLIGAPLSTWIMDHVSGFGLTGWRWMLVIEGIPAILGGIATYIWLTDTPAQAKWLKADERQWLIDELSREQAARAHLKQLSVLQAISNPRVLYLSVIYFVYQCGNLGVGYWMPQIIKGLSGSLTSTQIGLIAMLPYGFATVVMVLWSKHSDKKRERHLHTAMPLLAAAVALGVIGMTDNAVVAISLMAIALAGFYAFKAPFWALPGQFLSPAAAGVSIAAINSIGNLGGFVGPYMIGAVKDSTGSAVAGLLFLSGMVFVSFAMAILVRMAPSQASAPPGISVAPQQ
jgi:MFS transporter, ACS family, tartrate transporter